MAGTRTFLLLVTTLGMLAPLAIAGGLSKAQLLDLVQKNVDPDVIVSLINKDCVDFEVDSNAVLELSGSVPAKVLKAAIDCKTRSVQQAPQAPQPTPTPSLGAQLRTRWQELHKKYCSNFQGRPCDRSNTKPSQPVFAWSALDNVSFNELILFPDHLLINVRQFKEASYDDLEGWCAEFAYNSKFHFKTKKGTLTYTIGAGSLEFHKRGKRLRSFLEEFGIPYLQEACNE